MKFADMTIEDLSAASAEKQAELQKIIEAAGENPTPEQANAGVALADDIDALEAELASRKAATEEAAAKFEALKSRRFGVEASEQPAEQEPAEQEQPDEQEPEQEPAEQEAPAQKVEVTQEAKSGKVVALAAKSKRPAVPARHSGSVSMVAAAEVPNFGAGQRLNDLTELSMAVIERTKGFTPPQGDGQSVDIRKFGVASLALPFEDELVIDRGTDDMEVLYRAADESRLEGESLVAAGGWCSPSETMYDLAADESLEGILSLPEVSVKRGGIRYTTGPQFADFYAEAGFIQTEAQAIAGTTKPCYEVDCPAFTDVRLDAVGVCIKVPILTNAAWPELVNRFTSGTMIAHQHMVNANVIGRMVTLAGAAKVISGLGSSVADTMGGLELLADVRREAYRLPLKRTMEVVIPFWMKGNLRSDLANRNGVHVDAISDAQVDAHFRARNLNVQYVYDWQPITRVDDAGTATVNEALVYPETVNVLMYPAGTFVKGTSDIINLSAVYDAASLATNTYTGLFMEQGLLVAKMKYAADLITLPLNAAGRTGAANLTSTTGSWATGA